MPFSVLRIVDMAAGGCASLAVLLSRSCGSHGEVESAAVHGRLSGTEPMKIIEMMDYSI